MHIEMNDIISRILRKLSKRHRGKTICPSEIAREKYNVTTWRGKMELIRYIMFSSYFYLKIIFISYYYYYLLLLLSCYFFNSYVIIWVTIFG